MIGASPPDYDLGTTPPYRSLNRGTGIPPFFPTGRGNEFAVLHETGGVWAITRPQMPGVGVLRWLGFNVPGGLGLDVVDTTTGTRRTYHLDGDSARWFPFPQQGKLVNPQNGEANCVFPVPAIRPIGGQRIIPYAGDTAAVWGIPPRRSYRSVAITAALLAAIAGVRRLCAICFSHAAATRKVHKRAASTLARAIGRGPCRIVLKVNGVSCRVLREVLGGQIR